jgi:hypothetical protein
MRPTIATRVIPLVVAALCACQSYQFDRVQPTAIVVTTKVTPVNAKKLPPNLMLVVDRSGSMTDAVDSGAKGCVDASGQNYDPTSTRPCKWNDLKETVAAPGGFLDANGAIANFGLILFANDDACAPGEVVSFIGSDADATKNAAAVAALINDKTPHGGTPTAGSLSNVLSDSKMSSEEAGRDRIVMLLTDGAPNCNKDNDQLCQACGNNKDICFDDGQCKPTQGTTCVVQPDTNICLDENTTVDQVTALAGRNIRTFVIGFGADTKDPGSDAYRVLNEAAVAGGLARTDDQGNLLEPHFYQANSGAELTAALKKLIDVINKCDYLLAPPPPSGNVIEVVFVYSKEGDRELVLKPTTAAAAGDWTWDTGKSTVEITGDRCAEIQSAPEGLVVEIRYVTEL